MEEFKLCSDGEYMPVSFPCPPPYSGPYYYYPYEDIPLSPANQGNTNNESSSNGGASAPISSGAVAGIIVIGSSIFLMLCLVAVKFRRRFVSGSIGRVAASRSSDHAEESHVNSGDMLVNMAGCGLDHKLVNLLPACEYVGLLQEGKLSIDKERHECAVCLSLFEEKEIVRVLPKCKHTFHVQCIDKWFESHANCPLCRERITLQTIQLFFHPQSHDDQHPPAGPPLHQDLQHSHPHSNDQPASTNPPLGHVCVPNIHDQHVTAPRLPHPHQQNVQDQHVSIPELWLPCVQNAHDQQDGRQVCGLQDLHVHQHIYLVAASATDIDNTCAAQPYQNHNNDHPLGCATGARPFNDQKAAGYACRMHAKEDKNASNEGSYAHNIDRSQSTGPTCGMHSLSDHPHPLLPNDRPHGAVDGRHTSQQSQTRCGKVGVYLNPSSSKQDHVVDINDHKAAITSALAGKSLFPTHDVDETLHNPHNLLYMPKISTPKPKSRLCKALKKSLSTGSLEYGRVINPPLGGIAHDML